MEAKLVPQNRSVLATDVVGRRRRIRKPASVAVLTSGAGGVATDHLSNVKQADSRRTSTTSTEKTVYNDNWFDRMAIYYLSQSVQAATGVRNRKSGYESLVEAATAVSRNSNTSLQRELVIQALEKAFPRQILSLIQMVMPQSKFAREFFAVFTTVFFVWLIGPCEVKESEMNGKTEKNVVHIKKCRFLEQANCVGMCTNLCKIPSQTFIKNSLGMPVNMIPNFDDMSCDMVFGQEPPSPSDDPAFKQPCYKLCKANQKHSRKCDS